MTAPQRHAALADVLDDHLAAEFTTRGEWNYTITPGPRTQLSVLFISRDYRPRCSPAWHLDPDRRNSAISSSCGVSESRLASSTPTWPPPAGPTSPTSTGSCSSRPWRQPTPRRLSARSPHGNLCRLRP